MKWNISILNKSIFSNLRGYKAPLMWGQFVFCAAFILWYIIPRKGFDFTDHGYYLYNAFILSSGVVPTVGFASAVNALFMSLGVRAYLFYEILYCVLTMVATLFFYASLRRVIYSYTLPLVMIIGLACSRTVILSYQNVPQIFLLIGFAALFFGLKSHYPVRTKLLYGTSAIFLVFAALSNISLMPTLFVTLFCIGFSLDLQKEGLFFYATYILASFGLLVLYFLSPISIFGVIERGAAHGYSISQAVLKIPLLLRYIFSIPMVVFLFVGAVIRLLERSISRYYFYILLHGSFLLIAFSLVIYECFSSSHMPIHKFVTHQGLFLFKLLLVAFIFFMKLSNSTQKKMAIVAFMVITYACTLSLTTRSIFDTHLSLFALGSLLITTLWFEFSLKKSHKWHSAFMSAYTLFLLLVAMLSLSIFFQYVYRSSSVFSSKHRAQLGVIRGVYAGRTKLSVIQEISFLYGRYHCDRKAFFAYPSLPLLYYNFHKRAPMDQAWLSPRVGKISNLQAIDWLRHQKHWCALVASGFNGVAASHFRSLDKFLVHKSLVVQARHYKVPIKHSYYPWQFKFYVS